MMRADGVLTAVLPEARRLDRLARLLAFETEPDALLRLAALVDVDAAGMVALALRLRLSNAARDRLIGLAPPWPLDPEIDRRGARRALYRLGAGRASDLARLLAAEGRMGPERLAECLVLARDWTPPEFPLSGRDVVALGIPPGRRVGRLLAAVREWWEEGDFAADRARCLARLKALVTEPARTD
jgi:poly(A) polymerase